MTHSLAETCCARLPASALNLLGALRAHDHLRGLISENHLWLFWQPGDREMVLALLAIEGSQLFLERDGLWYRPGEHLPFFGVPDSTLARPLSALLFIHPTTAIPPGEAAWRPAPMALVRDGLPHPASALRLALSDLATWAERATSYQLQQVQAMHCQREVLLRGVLPPLPGDRFWGRQVLLPLGFRLEPNLPESVLAAALQLKGDDLALFTSPGVEILPGNAFGPVTRAGVRRARGGHIP